MSEKPNTARSYRTTILDDNAIVSINLKWLGQICFLIACLVYGYWQLKVALRRWKLKWLLRMNKLNLLSKHIGKNGLNEKSWQKK